MENILETILVVIAAPYILGPLVVLFSQRYPENYRLQKADEAKFIEAQTPTFVDLHANVVRAGFVHLGFSEMEQGGATLKLSVYLNAEECIFCAVSTMRNSLGATTQVEYTQAYTDSSVVNVNNSALLSVYPKDWRKETYRFPEINDLALLFAGAKKIFSLRGGKRTPMRLSVADGWKHPETFLNQELQALIERGWVSRSVYGGKRRLTIKGAVLLTWKVCWPVRGMLNRQQLLAARKVLNSA